MTAPRVGTKRRDEEVFRQLQSDGHFGTCNAFFGSCTNAAKLFHECEEDEEIRCVI